MPSLTPLLSGVVTISGVVSTYALTGTINDSAGAGLDGVTITLTGDASDSTTTAGGGLYSFAGLVDGSYTITPTKAGSTFSPTSDAVTVSGGAAVADTMAQVWVLSGTINDSAGAGLDDVLCTLSGDASDTDTTAGGGAYSFTGLADGDYTITPTKAGSTFSPASDAESISGADNTADTMAQVWQITGNIVDLDAAAISGVTVTLTGDASDSTTTDGSGDYEFTELSDGSYTVTPTKPETLAGWRFSAASSSPSVSGADATGEDFVGQGLFLTMPVFMDFDDATAGQTPAYVTGLTGKTAPTCENIGETIEGHTKMLRFQKGSGAAVGQGTIDAVAYLTASAGASFDTSQGLRIQFLDKMTDDKGRRVYYFNNLADWAAGGTLTDRLGFQDKEENNPDTFRVYLMKDESVWDTGDTSTGVNNDNINNWRYIRIVYNPGETTTLDVYGTNGTHNGSQHTVTWPTNGESPIRNCLHLYLTGGGGYHHDLAEVWIGSLTDDWPAI